MPYFIIYAVICVIIAAVWATKKRIGGEWGFFFLLFYSIILGSVIISMSPSKKKIKDLKDGFYGWDKAIGYTALLLAILGVFTFFNGSTQRIWFTEEQKQAEQLKYIFFTVGFAGVAYYMLTRFKRHEKMYNDANNPTVPEIKAEPVKEKTGQKTQDYWHFEDNE